MGDDLYGFVVVSAIWDRGCACAGNAVRAGAFKDQTSFWIGRASSDATVGAASSASSRVARLYVSVSFAAVRASTSAECVSALLTSSTIPASMVLVPFSPVLM